MSIKTELQATIPLHVTVDGDHGPGLIPEVERVWITLPEGYVPTVCNGRLDITGIVLAEGEQTEAWDEAQDVLRDWEDRNLVDEAEAAEAGL